MDAPKVERIVDNLLANAVSYTPAGTEILVRVERRRRRRADRGGRSRAWRRRKQREAIFEIFNRGESVGTWPAPASGYRSSPSSPRCTAAGPGSRTTPAVGPRSGCSSRLTSRIDPPPLFRGIGCEAADADNTSMRRAAVIPYLLVFALSVSALAQAGEFRPELERLRPADVALAKRTTVRAADLASGWMRQAPAPSSDQKLDCPGVDLDFSRFTITGTAKSKFGRTGASIESYVEVYKSRVDAAGDFRKGSRPAVLACIARMLDKEARRTGNGRVVSARSLADPRVGERAMAYRVVVSVATDRGAVQVYVDFLGFQRGRTAVLLAFTAGGTPITGRVPLARAVAARTR